MGREVVRIDLATDKWEEMPNLKKARGGHSSVTLVNTIYVFGGCSAENFIERLGIPGTTTVYNKSSWKLLEVKFFFKHTAVSTLNSKELIIF